MKLRFVANVRDAGISDKCPPASPQPRRSLPRHRKSAFGPMTYFVITRREDTGELVHLRAFPLLRQAKSAKCIEQEKPNHVGGKYVVSIESLLTGQLPE